MSLTPPNADQSSPVAAPVVAVILARAGSKGLPGKNAAIVAGRPMLLWTIDHARAARGLTHIYLSTDGAVLADLGRSAGIGVIERPAALATDHATVDAAARHAVETIESQIGTHTRAVVILYANVPLRPPGLIDGALEKLFNTGCDSVQSVCPVGKMHPYWMKTLGSAGRPSDALGMYQDNAIYRRQDLPPVYMLDGGIIAVTRQSLFTVEPGQPHAFLGRDRRAVLTQPGEVVDVDDATDLRLADILLKQRKTST